MFRNYSVTDSSRGLKSVCKFKICKKFAKILHRRKFLLRILQLFCNFFAIFLQLFCNFFAIFLQFFCKIFVNWFGIRTKGIHFRVTSRRGCWMIDSWPLVLFFFWKNFFTFFAKNLQKCFTRFAKKLQKSWKKIAKELQKSCKKVAKKLQNAEKKFSSV